MPTTQNIDNATNILCHFIQKTRTLNLHFLSAKLTYNLDIYQPKNIWEFHLFHVIIALNLVWNQSKGHKILSPDITYSAASWELEGISKCNHYNPHSWQAYTVHLLLVLFCFSPEGPFECACRKNSLQTLTARQTSCNRSSPQVGSPAETLPICGAGA